ncbi:kinesin [Sporormia fimetaria CBS 119925]|uniref:Kinesin-like protein n=1 Tax=Sporormia fimetaria CBS 119925 TaxID=1340428 RepID=A0A6A6V3N8_9PLEO|nr:kinesin [Sporormia fimetaria CBS 119925]
MEPPPRPSSSLFDVYLRLRPSHSSNPRFLNVEEPAAEHPTHITIKPPTNDNRKRAVEKFAFTRVFEEDAQQMDLFRSTGVLSMVDGVLGGTSRHGRDCLLATLGVTGSGKSHTILGTKSQRGLTQMALDVLFQATGQQLVQSFYGAPAFSSLVATDVSEANMFTASAFLDAMYGDSQSERCPSRAQTSMLDCSSFITNPSSRSKNIPRPSALPQNPAVHDIELSVDPKAEYAIIISMYEVYNDRIFDLLSSTATKNKHPTVKRRALLFKNTEQSPDRKVVAGLTKIICGSFDEALMVLETGLMERKVAGTGSNAVSSRSHGFFCVEVKKRNAERKSAWTSSTLTIVDLAGSERARQAKTAGATLAEAGKINESLMYLGQCMQMQSDHQDGARNIVPFRQCKLTELLFSNSFPSTTTRQTSHYHQPQKSIMIVTADPKGDFNATSQILRYSALAREVTVPRIPSTTSTILHGTIHKHSNDRTTTSSGRTTPSAILEELETAQSELARLSSNLEVLALRLAEETQRRRAAEHSWQAAEAHMVDLEQEIRDECFAATEAAVLQERRRWQAAWDAEQENKENHLDKKIDVVIQATKAHMREQGKGKGYEEHEEPGMRERMRELEEENRRLKRRVDLLERAESEAPGARSPVKRMRVLKNR